MKEFKIGEILYVDYKKEARLICEVVDVNDIGCVKITTVSGNIEYDKEKYWPSYVFNRYSKKNIPQYFNEL